MKLTFCIEIDPAELLNATDKPKLVKEVSVLPKVKIPTKRTQVLKDKNCAICGKAFTPHGPAQKRCSWDCGMVPKYRQAIAGAPEQKKPIKVIGNQEFYITPEQIERSQSKPYNSEA